MTEDEAKKILDFLFRRLEKTISNSYMSGRKHHVEVEAFSVYRSELHVEYAVFYEDGSVNSVISQLYSSMTRSSIEYFGCSFFGITSRNIAECLFSAAKNEDVITGECYVVVFRGESLEEILVKADLEEVNDRR